jgi:dTDP-glucose 4,6-dehydratase
MAEKVFVIGSNAFTGATFVACALGQGCDVFGCSRSPEPSPVFLPYKWNHRPSPGEAAGQGGTGGGRFQFARLDLNHDTDRITAAIADFKPDYVVNFAAQSMVAESWLYPEHWYQTNVVANVRLHEKIRAFDFIKKYVHVSTPEVYGSCSGNVTENAPFNPSTPYAASRAACDLHLLTFFKNYKFPVVFTRAANVYGPGQQLYRIIPRTVFFIRTGRPLQLHGGGRSVRSFIHARDVSDGTLRVARQAPAGEAYHFSTGLYVSIRELVERICQRMGVQFEQVVQVVGDRPGKDAAYLLDSTKARTTLGWQDHVSLDAGIEETIAWVDKNFEELQKQPCDYIHKA